MGPRVPACAGTPPTPPPLLLLPLPPSPFPVPCPFPPPGVAQAVAVNPARGVLYPPLFVRGEGGGGR